ncbi:hypothetical protein R1sor_022450 [Riccia sorocarpa]|uniref:Reverse transcriptase/retrotransposon-derived protein RNase H-like domain-containing protein n=1 Tax=Riccia sorocarpa TaxID=122646 RepID=A0ABD3GP41_9MARC
MNKVLKDFIPEKTMPFLEDIPIKGCRKDEKDETLDRRGCRKYVGEHIQDCEKILSKLEEVHLTLSEVKSTFGVREIVIVGHLCGSYGQKPDPRKIDAIQRIKKFCRSLTEVRRFLGACVFYHVWIPHYAHVADPIYELCMKGVRFTWAEKHAKAIRKMKQLLSSSPFLKQIDYRCGRPVILTTDTSPIAIGWAVGQDDAKGDRFATRFGARVLSKRQRSYPHVKKELWRLVTAMKAEKEYLIGAEVVVETDCLPLLGMIANCMSTDMAMLNWIAYIKTLNPEFRHIAGKDNPLADMLSRVRYEGEEDMIEDTDDIGRKFYSVSQVEGDVEVVFREELYEGEWLDLGRYLESLEMQEGWSNTEFSRIRKKSYDYMLRDGYGCVGKITADGGELDAQEAKDFFKRYGLKLSLTTAYNPEGNAKSERRHPPIVKALVKACNGKVREWPRLFPFALWADRTTHSSVTGYMPAELVQGQKPIMPVEEQIPFWSVLPWADNLTREELLELRIRQLEQRDEDVCKALERLKAARLRNKDRFHRRHRLRPRAIEEGDWVLVYDSSLDNQHSAFKKFAKRWFGPYVVEHVYDNATYGLRELDGARLRRPIAGKRHKIFKKRDGDVELMDVRDDDRPEEIEEDLDDDDEVM